MDRLVDDRGPVGRLVLRQVYSHFSHRFRAALLAVSGGLLCSPFLLMLFYMPARSDLGALPDVSPIVGLQLAFAAALGLSALVAGLFRLSQPAIRSRVVDIDTIAAVVKVEQVVGRHAQQWQEPLAVYRGLRHSIVTTSEGAFHSLVLEHSRARRSVELAYAPHLSDREMADLSQRLALPILVGGPSSAKIKRLLLRVGHKLTSPAKKRHRSLSRGHVANA